MLRIFSGVCLFPKAVAGTPHTTLLRHPKFSSRFLARCVAFLALGIPGTAGCAQEQVALARGAAQERDVSSTQAAPDSKPSTQAVAASSPSNNAGQPAPPTSPATETPAAASASQGSILDLVGYKVQGPNDGNVAARIRATVNGIAILDEEVRGGIYPALMVIQRLPEPERSVRRKEIFDRQVDHLIEREVILQEAMDRFKEHLQILDKLKEAANKEFEKKIHSVKESQHIKSDEEFKAVLRAQGLTLADVQRQIEREFMAVEYMRNLILPALDRISREQIEDYYAKHPEQFEVKDSVTWDDIFIDAAKYPSREAARQFAEQLAARAGAGTDFKPLAKQYDQGDSSYRNGEGYGHLPGEIKPPEAEPVLFRMRAGDIGPVIETRNGFHVIRLDKRDYQGIKPFDTETQRTIKKKLEAETWDREYKRIVADMKSRASIQVSTH